MKFKASYNFFLMVITFLVVFSVTFQAFSQVELHDADNQPDPFQFGGAISFTFEVQKFSNYHLSLTGGIGRKIDGLEFIQPTFHSELKVFQGGMGSSLSSLKRQRLNVDLIFSFMVVAGIREAKTSELLQRFTPINFFTDDSSSPLQNPYYNSIGIGTNFILSSDNFRDNQYLGVLNLNIERSFQLNYYNDGTPYHWIGLGDGFDRYYTGGGFLAVYLDHIYDINYIQVSYNKFTGYQPYGFEVANNLQIDFLPYKNPESFYFNQSRWRGKIGNHRNGYNLTLSGYDLQKSDGQDLIHYLIDNSYHPDPYRKCRFGLGISYNHILYNSL